MNKADKIRRQAPGLAEGDVCALASLGTTEVDIIARALRQARRDAVAHEKELKRQRKIDNRAHSNYDEADYVPAQQGRGRQPGQAGHAGQPRRAGRAREPASAHRHLDRVGVDGCRAQGYSDADIGDALGITRQSVWERFRRKENLAREETVT